VHLGGGPEEDVFFPKVTGFADNLIIGKNVEFLNAPVVHTTLSGLGVPRKLKVPLNDPRYNQSCQVLGPDRHS
jgi:hypothetical protein